METNADGTYHLQLMLQFFQAQERQSQTFAAQNICQHKEALGCIWFWDLRCQVGPLPAIILSSFGLHLVLGSEMSGGPPIGHYFKNFRSKTPLPRSESSSDFLSKFVSPLPPQNPVKDGFGVRGIGIPFYWISFNIINLIPESIDPTTFSGTLKIPLQ